jgi:hypothetical protein
MRTTRLILASALIALSMGACSSGGDDKPPVEATKQPTATVAPSDSPEPEPSITALALGKPTETIGNGGAGVLELTPTSVVYVTGSMSTKPTKDVFAFVTVKARSTKAVAAEQVPPITGGGWKWVAADGQAIDEGNGEAYNVVSDSFNAGGPIEPGTFVWDGITFDLTKAQQGGTLLYTDGNGTAYRWTVPAADAGPQVAQVKKELAP